MKSMRRIKINIFGVLALVFVAMSATAQKQSLSGFGDNYGEHVFYLEAGSHSGDVHQLFWDFSAQRECDIDLTLKAHSSVASLSWSDIASYSDATGEHAY